MPARPQKAAIPTTSLSDEINNHGLCPQGMGCTGTRPGNRPGRVPLPHPCPFASFFASVPLVPLNGVDLQSRHSARLNGRGGAVDSGNPARGVGSAPECQGLWLNLCPRFCSGSCPFVRRADPFRNLRSWQWGVGVGFAPPSPGVLPTRRPPGAGRIRAGLRNRWVGRVAKPITLVPPPFLPSPGAGRVGVRAPLSAETGRL